MSIASLLVHLKNDIRYGKEFTVEHLSFNMFGAKNLNKIINEKLPPFNLRDFDTIGISCYVWNEFLINPLIKDILNLGYVGKIVLGGYQISYGDKINIHKDYPDANIFISDNAEESFLKSIFLEKSKKPIFLNEQVDFLSIPSVYTTGELPVSNNQYMVRWETKRGCPYKCTFCAHRDLGKNKVYKHDLNKLHSELSFFKRKNVKRLNILDPIFNAGNTYLDILKLACDLNLQCTITMQTRFELIRGTQGDNFINLCKKINSHLEFGLQTANENESNIIDRKNNINTVREVLNRLNVNDISYEVSLIYGLPMQTVQSFKDSIDFLIDNGCKSIVAYPLMLLKGTELYAERNKYDFVEKKLGSYNIPTVISSNTFTEMEWLEMDTIAKELNSNGRV